MFQTSLVKQSLVLFSLAIHKFCDECRRHLSSSCHSLSSMRTWSPSSSFLVKLIHVQSTHAFVIFISSYSNGFYHQHQSSLVWLLLTTFDGWFASLPLRVFRPESRDEILFRGEGCDSSCTCKLDIYFVSVMYVLVSVKFMCIYVKLLKI
jgi:hypothetical protein